MVKFLIALAELFSSFSAKLHDMSETVEEAPVWTARAHRGDIIDVVNRAVRNGDIELEGIDADDIVGLTRYVENVCGDQTIEASDIDDLEEFVMGCLPDTKGHFNAYMHRQKCLEVIMQYSSEYDLHKNINFDTEVEKLNRHMLDRVTEWSFISPKI